MARNQFNSIQLPNVDSNRFDLSHDNKLSFSMGELVPTCAIETLPGDTFNISVENMLRLAPLVSPVMHNIDVITRYFFVPNRILWAEWGDFITGNSVVEAPYVAVSDCNVGTLADYLGVPEFSVASPLNLSPLAFAAYLKIWDDYYRAQDLQTEVFVPLVPGDNGTAYGTYFDTTPPLRVAWEHDYFTSALPFAQKGPEVQIPLTFEDNIPVEFNPTDEATFMRDTSDGSLAPIGDILNSAGPVPLTSSVHVDTTDGVGYDPNGSLVVDVQAEATTINTLRRAFSLQAFLERSARGGTRLIEFIWSHFKQKSSDARLQRPELIGTWRQKMVISEVLATAENDTVGVMVGDMAGHGISVGGGRGFSYHCEEHGWIIGLVTVRPRTAYQQGIARQFTRFDRLDYPFPSFASIGEQEVLSKEVYAESLTPETVFGYIPRYAEMRFINSKVSGQFRTTLAFWHLGRIFDDTPVLNEEFIECNPRTDIFAVDDPDQDHIWAHVFNNISAVRKLPRYGIPSTL